MTLEELNTVCTLVKTAAKTELLPRFRKQSYREKADGSLVTEADLAMQAVLEAGLKQAFPDTLVLGEEMEEEIQKQLIQQTEKSLWCIDPLDGTSNFAAGLPFFGVSVALIEQGEVTAGVVYDPLREECFTALLGQGARLNGEVIGDYVPPTPLNKGVVLVDFKRLNPTLATRLATQPPYGSQRSLGSVVLDWCWVATGRCHAYLHGKQNLWDYAAGNLILLEAGGYAQTLEGEKVFSGDLTPRSAISALDEAIFQQWRSYLT